MKLNHSVKSPNFSKNEIPVEFCILHYTACDLKKTLEIFQDPSKGVCSHFVIGQDGECFDLGSFETGPIFQGAHAGKSLWKTKEKTFEKFNEFSIGIELVNLNGNLFPYPPAQIKSLIELLKILQNRFPVLKNSNRILGHEHIAGFRGKADPGIQFDWKAFLSGLNLKTEKFHSLGVCELKDLEFLKSEIAKTVQQDAQFWMDLNSKLEKRIGSKTPSI